MEFEKHFCREAFKVQRGKVLKENSIAGRTWSSEAFFMLKLNAAIDNRDVLLTGLLLKRGTKNNKK